MKRTIALGIAVLTGTLVTLHAALAINYLQMRDLPIQYMTDEDMDVLRMAAVRVLDGQPDGETTRWENPKTGAHGDLTPRATFERTGQPCRDMELANSVRGRNNRLVLTFCKQPDGEWKVDRN